MNRYRVIRRDTGARGKYHVKDGIIRYVVSLDPAPTCQCHGHSGDPLCDHLLFILRNEYSLSDFSLRHLMTVYETFLTTLADAGDINQTVERTLMEKFDGEDCGICLSRLSNQQYKLDLAECRVCHKFTHRACRARWTHGCIYCRTP